MKREKTQREKRLFQLMMLIIGCVISVFLNGFLAVGNYVQYQNIIKLKQSVDEHVEMIEVYEGQRLLNDERLEELTQSILMMQQEIDVLLTKTNNGAPNTNQRKVAYLTFDDGPTDMTPKVLDVLKEHEVTATFFLLGNNVKRHPELVRRIVAEGHTVGNHSHTHRYEKIYISLDALRAEITYCNDEIFKAAGVEVSAFRFPGGSSNSMFYSYAPDLPRKAWFDLIHEMGMEYYDWNVTSLDASGKSVTSSQIIQSVVSGAANKNVINVLMHDVSKNQSTLEALPEIIIKLKDMGYSLEAITSNSAPVQHKIAE